MAKILIAGIDHASCDTLGGFMSADSLRQFQERIEPQLTNGSLILMESFDYKELIRPGHRLYPRICEALGVRFQNIHPSFGGFDPRCHPDPDKQQRNLQRMMFWTAVAEDLFGNDMQDVSYKEGLQLLAKEEFPKKLRRSPTREEVDLARWVLRLDREFDKRYLAALARYRPKFDVCVLIMGAAHALSLAFAENLPLEVLMESRMADQGILHSYLTYYVWPEIVANFGR